MKRPVAVRVVGPTHWIFIPSLIACVATVVLATPVRLFGLSLPEPVAPLVLAFAWPLIRPSILAPAMLFALGLFLDLLWGGGLGVWPFTLLVVYVAVLLSRNLLAGQDQVLIFWYLACVLVAFALAYLFVAAAANNPPSLIGLLGQLIPTALLWPAAHWMLERFDDGDTRFR